MKPKRQRHEIAWRNGRWEWRWHNRGKWKLIDHWPRKADLVGRVALILRQDWAIDRHLAELQIKGKDGRIQDCRTYGRDPRRTRG